MIKSLYLHIPFCNKICSYCDFCKILYNKNLVNKYLSVLEEEINNVYKNDILDTIYIGGGTPSSLDVDELEKLFIIISKLRVSKNLEFTIECNFNSINVEKLCLFKKYGVNRLSFGIESINDNNLLFLNREESRNKILDTIKLCRNMDFNNINVDLIYAIPGEDLSILKEDVNFVLSLNVEHISTYSLIIENNTMLGINKVKSIDDELDFSMYQFICSELNNNGYNHYEISNFSKSGFESRHNLCYWNNNYYYGFGLGAASYIDNYRISNTRSITRYLNKDILMEKEFVDDKEKIEYEIILNLRKSTGIDLLSFHDNYGVNLFDMYDYSSLVDDGLLVLFDDMLYIPEEKWYISNEIIVRLLGCGKNGL